MLSEFGPEYLIHVREPDERRGGVHQRHQRYLHFREPGRDDGRLL